MVTTTWSQTAGMTSETGTDNIEDYAEQAEASKDAAAASETASANSAAASASSASGSSASASEALASKNAAAASETSAAASAATATTQASNSSTSATASETSRVASVAAQAAAETAETAAETAQAAAEAAEAGVAADAATATAQAAIATTQATNSGTSATASEASRVAAVAAQAAAETAETNAETAETNAETAQVAAEAAETSASGFSTSASTSAATATTQAGIATTKAGEAAASATASASSATASEAAKDAALSALDNFQDQYLGDFASDPTTDNDGDPLQAGMLYFNTTDDVMKVYTGSAWVAAYASLSGALLTSNNLSDLVNVPVARTNLGLGTAATTAATDYATAAQGALADSAVQPSDSPTFGSVTVTGTVDGRDVAADGTKLDGIEAGATADQTKADIDALGIAASTASTLATARNIAVTGAVTGNADFDGSGNISISTTATSDPTITLGGDLSGSATLTNLGDATLTATITANSVALGTDTTGNYVAGITAGAAITVTGSGSESASPTINHADTSSQGSVNNSGATVIQDVTLDTYGHVTALGSHTLTLADLGYTGATNANYITNNNQLTNGAGYTTYTSNQATNTSSNVTHNQVTGTAWVYSPGYLQAPNAYIDSAIYHSGDTDTRILFDTNTIYLQTGGSSEITVNTTGVRLGDTGNGYFQPVSGSYGSIQIDGGAHGGYEGYSIGGRVVFMHNNGTAAGIYDDVNNEWMVNCTLNGAVNLYYNGASKLDTLSTGVSINGNLYTDGSNAEDYDAISGTSPTCNVDNAGAFSLTMSGNTTFTFSGADNGWSMGFILKLVGNGSTVTWPSSVDWAGGTAPDAPASGETDIYVFWTINGGSTWYGVQSIDAAA